MNRMYQMSFGLFTDLYQLTMAYGYWRKGMADRESVYHLTFRRCPFGGEYAVSCGLGTAIDFLESYRFPQEDLEYLASLQGADGKALFDSEFLRYLAELRFDCDVDGIPEGTVTFAHEPLLRVRGPMLQCQLVETGLLNIINFQTLVATKAARICREAGAAPVLEFGLRRAQGIDGGLMASRAAVVGGCAATSNVLAGRLHGLPVKGTHAHSWVMAFPEELAAFEAYANAMPNNCVFLVDTYDTLQGVKHAIQVGHRLREQGHDMLGVRLDSGDLGELSRQARQMLDEAGFTQAAVVASSDLDEYRIRELREAGSEISVWGVGTRLATCYEQPALGGVYKLGAIRDSAGNWKYRVKLSEEEVKVSNPGIQQVLRYHENGSYLADMIFDEPTGYAQEAATPITATSWPIGEDSRVECEKLLVPVFRKGNSVYKAPSAMEARERTQQQLARLPAEVTRLVNPSPYPVALEKKLLARKREVIAEMTMKE